MQDHHCQPIRSQHLLQNSTPAASSWFHNSKRNHGDFICFSCWLPVDEAPFRQQHMWTSLKTLIVQYYRLSQSVDMYIKEEVKTILPFFILTLTTHIHSNDCFRTVKQLKIYAISALLQEQQLRWVQNESSGLPNIAKIKFCLTNTQILKSPWAKSII